MTTVHRFAPRTIAAARTQRARSASRRLRVAMLEVRRILLEFHTRLAGRWQDARDLQTLSRADERQLADIGLTRCDLVGPPRAMAAAGRRREEAMALARARSKGLPQTDSPSLMPAPPKAHEVLRLD
jgi:hypothetical protein